MAARKASSKRKDESVADEKPAKSASKRSRATVATKPPSGAPKTTRSRKAAADKEAAEREAAEREAAEKLASPPPSKSPSPIPEPQPEIEPEPEPEPELQPEPEAELEPEVEPDTDEDEAETVDFKAIKSARVIDESVFTKAITYEGIYNENKVIVRLEKTPFDDVATKNLLSQKDLRIKKDFTNDIYSSYMIAPPNSSFNDIKATVVYPATAAVLAKYTRDDSIFFSETPDVYMKVVEPFIDSKFVADKDHNRWLYNILEGKTEADRVIMNDPDENSGFLLVPDLKWLGDEKELNLLAICHRRDIRSLRDLDDKHLVLLKNILTKVNKVVKDKFKKLKGQLRSYIHYQPSFYHFHVHFKMVDASDYLASDRDNLLTNVINNINLNKDYYKKATLTYPLSQASPLYQELKKKKRV